MTLAVVVTYNPPAAFFDTVNALMAQVDELLIVDNGSSLEWRNGACAALKAKFGNIEFLFNERNLGIAAALNQGFARAIQRGFDSVFAFDGDSLPTPGMVAEVLDVYHSHPDGARVAVVAPDWSVPAAGVRGRFLRKRGRFFFERVSCEGRRTLEDVSVVISSGALYDLRAYEQVGPFRDDFFIDYVDTEYCLRSMHHGYNVVVACRALLIHELGNQKEAHFGPLTMHPMFHAPVRWYYISRNRIPMMQMYALRWPHWLLYELVINTYGLVRLLLFEDQKRAKVRAMLLGTWDGLTKRMGPISLKTEAAIARAKASA